MKGKRWVIGLMTCFLMFLTGCLSVGSENFYALPQRSEKYRDLQAAVERAMGSGVYAAPVSGSNRQAIQQADLDGDGREEALVFCRIGTEHPLKVLILKRTEEDYRLVCTIEGDGSAFDSVQYAQIDGAPGQELLLSRRISDQVQQSLTVYKLKDNAPVELMSSSYSAYTLVDMDSDNCTDVFLLGTNPEGPVGFADLYRCRDGVMQKDVEANLSTPAESVKRMITGCVSSGVPAVFVASAYDENSLITDVFTLRNNIFANISQNAESGQSSQTVRNYFVYSTDIDNDGVIEMPNTVPLTELPEDEASQGQYRITWYNLGVDGKRTDKMSTYHNYSEGWFFYLPEDWCSSLAVTREDIADGKSGVCFCSVSADGTRSNLLTVASFTGQDAEKQISAAGFFVITIRGDAFFAGKLSRFSTLTKDDVIARFKQISPDLLPETNG